MPTRRHLLQLAASAFAAPVVTRAADAAKEPLFKISLAEWSLNKGMFKKGGAEPVEHLDFAKIARSLGIDGIEYVNQMFFDKAKDNATSAR
jgi:L-ribulose-5-phosphate 3-epimerase